MLIPAIALALSACTDSAPPPVQTIPDKGGPFDDLLVPKLQASVTDGPVGIEVAQPVTVRVDGGVLGPASMVNEEGEPVAGQLSPTGWPGRAPSRWVTTSSTGCGPRRSAWAVSRVIR